MYTTIYALVDPRNAEIRYVGQAVDVFRRYQQHIDSPGNGTQLYRAWILRLAELGLRPGLRILERKALATEGYIRECYWIAHYKAQDHDLLNQNGPGCRRHFRSERWRALRTESVQPGELVGQRPLIKAWNRKITSIREHRQYHQEIKALAADFLHLGETL